MASKLIDGRRWEITPADYFEAANRADARAARYRRSHGDRGAATVAHYRSLAIEYRAKARAILRGAASERATA